MFYGRGYFGTGYYGNGYWHPSGVAVVQTNTPGFPPRIPSQTRGEDDEEKRERRIREGTIAPLVSDDGRLAEYSAKSAKIAAAIARLRDETSAIEGETQALRDRIEAATREKVRARLERELMLKEQAMQLAQAQEAALVEELTVIDIAYVAIIALGAVLN